MKIVPNGRSHADVQRIIVSAVVPRPIAFVSTLSAGGLRNLAPFSFFNAVCTDPPVICFAAARPGAGAGKTKKDTLSNVEATGEFVVNIVSEAIAGRMNITAGEYPAGVDEFALAGLTAAESELVKPPRVAESPVSFECKLLQNIVVSERAQGSNLILGEVVCVHVDDAVLDADGRIDPDRLRAVGRMGGFSYSRTTDRFDLVRPK
jgi:flavin reductase (DIM6/NTAB) family NADH-FMN oxidoreductase RutF